jgi:two-component system, sensor histidine kinase and response regulator
MESPNESLFALSILIVEDNRETGEILRRLIAMKFPSASVSVSGDGLDGLTFFKEHRPDIVITDIHLAGMYGLQLVSEIKSAGHQVKVIVVTGYSETSYLHQVSQLGIDDYILKPVQLELLYSTIDRCLAEITYDRHSRQLEDSIVPANSSNHPIGSSTGRNPTG